MDFTDPLQRAAFFEIHRGLPREGPGEGDSTLRALALCGALPAAPRVLDIACGPGAQSLDLAAALPDATIVALDAHAPFLAQLEARATAAGLAGRVTTRLGDMAALDFAPASFDLIWCEGAAYIMGVPAALAAWKPLLAPGGRLALTEAVWLRPDPPEEARRNWEDYPAMGDVAATRTAFARAGYALLDDFVLPPSAWRAYYGPIEARLELLESSDDPAALAIRGEARAEIAAWRLYGDWFGYAFFVARL